MTDQPTTPSGSRWEPGPDDAPTTESPQAPGEERRAQLRRRAGLAGAATALVLGAGVTGFAVGHSTAGGGRDRFSPADFSGQVPGGGQLGEGQQGPPGFGDRDGGHAWGQDGDGGLGQQPPGAGGSSGSSSSNGSGTSANPT